MPITVKSGGKSPQKLDNYDLCIWCYDIEWVSGPKKGAPGEPDADQENPFKPGSVWGLDFSPEIKIRDPKIYTDDVKKAHPEHDGMDYEMPMDKEDQPEPKRTIVFKKIPNPSGSPPPPITKFRICIITPNCKDNVEEIEVSLEHRKIVGEGDNMQYHWEKMGKNHKVEGPASFAGLLPNPQDEVAILARYEGLKLITLLPRVAIL